MANFNVRPETGSDIYQLARNARLASGQNNTSDQIVSTTGRVQLSDLEGALERAEQTPAINGAFEDAIFLETRSENGQAEYLKVDLKDPVNRQLIDSMIADLRNGVSVTLDPRNFNMDRQLRPTTLDFGLNQQGLEAMGRSPDETMRATGKAIQSAFNDFEYNNMKDGQSLTDQEKLNLAVKSMTARGVDSQTQEMIIGRLFFGSGGNDAERIDQIQTAPNGDVSVSFLHIANSGDTRAITAQNFPAVAPYQGTDDNRHQSHVDRIHQGVYNSHTHSDGVNVQRPIVVQGTHLGANRAALESNFLASAPGEPYRDMSPAERQSNTTYQSLVADYQIANQQSYVSWGADQAFQMLQSQAGQIPDANLASQALNIVMNLRNPNFLMAPHTVPTLEDEAAVAKFMDRIEQLRSGDKTAAVRTNYDNDNNSFNIGPSSERPAPRHYHTQDAQDPKPVVEPPPFIPIERSEFQKAQAEQQQYERAETMMPELEARRDALQATIDEQRPPSGSSIYMQKQANLNSMRELEQIMEPKVKIDSFTVEVHNSSEFSAESKALWQEHAPRIVAAQDVSEGQGHLVEGRKLEKYANLVDSLYAFEDAVRSGDAQAIEAARQNFERQVSTFTMPRF
ncbi:MAG: hypothetical protein CVV27_06930 [Candidatus Melainabacteria bacterium HGW-Melainabacteria-1]|nr:MAG: hypothetical protein CVV27_06930 [Candidatus Melainabacteria bacterium HGW-Melainabacteria-1]